MNVKTILRKRKAVSAVVSAILLIGLSITVAGILYGVLDFKMDSNVTSAAAIRVEDSDGDGLVDRMTVPLLNNGLADAKIDSVSVIQDGNTLLWFTFENEIDMSEYTEIDIYAIGTLQQVQPGTTFYVEIIFEDEVYRSSGYTTIDEEVVDEVEDPFVGYTKLVKRTANDDHYARKDFPADEGYSPTLWFLLGEFEDNNKRADIDVDYISLNNYGDQEDFKPYLLDSREFTEGNIGFQSDNKVTPYNDSGEHPGLIALDDYGNWDKDDNLNWGKYGIVYMWSYIYNPGTEAITADIGANGASEYQLYLNGDYLLSGNKKNKWVTSEDITFAPGLNLVMMKLSGKTDAHFAGQVLFFNSEQLVNLYSVWPTAGDL